MEFQQMGEVYAYLLAHREVSADPLYRRRLPDEVRIAGILEAAVMSGSLSDFESFLNGQGFTLRLYDSTYFGKAFDKGDSRRASSYFVLARIDMARAPHIDRDWFDRNFSDTRRKNETREQRIIWGIQLWLILQSLFYTRLGRTVSEVSRFGEAVVTEGEFITAVREFMEKIRNKGRPEGEKGIVWDIIVRKTKSGIESRAKKFLDLMEKAGMVERIKDAAGEDNIQAYRQSILAATEMSINISRGLDYLKPPESNEEPGPDPVDVIKGYLE